jgi:hypothetical protein
VEPVVDVQSGKMRKSGDQRGGYEQKQVLLSTVTVSNVSLFCSKFNSNVRSSKFDLRRTCTGE